MKLANLGMSPFDIGIRWAHLTGVGHLEAVLKGLQCGYRLNFIGRYNQSDDG
jgi:hypothetical protein